MTAYPDAPFPERPFYSCDETALEVVDQAQMASLLRGGGVEPWIRLEVGPENAIDSPPVRVAAQDGAHVTIECRDGVVHIDFEEETVQKTSSDGATFIYMGALQEANQGGGWIRAR